MGSNELCRKFNPLLLLASAIISSSIIVSFPQIYPYGQNQVNSAYASSLNSTLYFDCGDAPDEVTIEAFPVKTQTEYNILVIPSIINFPSISHTNSWSESDTLGNGEGISTSTAIDPSIENETFLAALYEGNNSKTTPIAQGVGNCSKNGMGTSANMQNLEQQCLGLMDKIKETNGTIMDLMGVIDVKLIQGNCKTMNVKSN